MDKDKEHQEGTFTGDVLAKGLGNPEHGGRTRVVGSYAQWKYVRDKTKDDKRKRIRLKQEEAIADMKKELLKELLASINCVCSPPAPNPAEVRRSSCGSRVFAPHLQTDECPCDRLEVHKLQHIIFQHEGPWNYDILSNLNLLRIYRYPHNAFC